VGTDSQRRDFGRVQEWTADPSEAEETVEDEQEGGTSELLFASTSRQEGTELVSARESGYEMMMKEQDIPAAVTMKIFRRPTRSIKRRDRQEQMAYSVPTQAAKRWLISESKWKEEAMMVLA
jgi:hypothetical protein